MADNPTRSSMATPMGDSLGTPGQPGGSDGQSHQSPTRPEDSGFVFGNAAEIERRQNGMIGGTLVATVEPKLPGGGTGAKASAGSGRASAPKADAVTPPPAVPDELPKVPAADAASVVTGAAAPDQAELEPAAVATNADNTPGPRPSSEEKAEAKAKINVPSETKADGQVRPKAE